MEDKVGMVVKDGARVTVGVKEFRQGERGKRGKRGTRPTRLSAHTYESSTHKSEAWVEMKGKQLCTQNSYFQSVPHSKCTTACTFRYLQPAFLTIFKLMIETNKK